MNDFKKWFESLDSKRPVGTPEEIARAAAIIQRLMVHPLTDKEIIVAGATFITFTPLGGV